MKNSNPNKFIRYVGSHESLVIDWVVSNICNYNCYYCPEASKDGSSGWPNLQHIRSTIKQVKLKYPNKKISYTLLGGELTIWKDFISFVDLLRTETPDCSIKLLTNGSMPSRFWKTHGYKFDSIQFSYHVVGNNDHLDRFISSVNSSSAKNNTVFVMAPPENWTRVIDSYSAIVKNVNNARIISAKPVDNRAYTKTNSLSNYTANQLNWIKTSKVINNTIVGSPAIKYFGVTETGDHVEVDPMMLISSGDNNWRGWRCAIGAEKITFKIDGNITKGSSCEVGGIIGNWHDGVLYDFSTDWVTCPYDHCFCGADVSVSRSS